MGIVRAVCISDKRGIQKKDVGAAYFEPGYGIKGDAHGGNWHRQVSLLSYERIEEFNKKGAEVGAGDFAENLVVEGFDFKSLPVGTQFKCGDVLLEMTQIGKECHSHCQIFHKMGDCIMPREGVFAVVKSAGRIAVGDEMTMIPPSPSSKLRAAVMTLSDKGSAGEREDRSGPLIEEALTRFGYEVVETVLLPDERTQIEEQLKRLSDGRQVDLILTTGGTGFSERDTTPEATLAVATRNAPGIAEAIRIHSLAITSRAMLSRGASVIRNKTLIINLPGSPKAVGEIIDYIMPSIEHGIQILKETTGECATATV